MLTDDPETYAKLKHMTTTAKVPDKWEYIHDEVGYNFRLPNLNAALGCAQMDKLPAFIESKRRLAAKYAESFERQRKHGSFPKLMEAGAITGCKHCTYRMPPRPNCSG